MVERGRSVAAKEISEHQVAAPLLAVEPSVDR